MLRVDECGLAASLLYLGDGVESQGSLTGGFRSVDLNNTATGKSAHAQRQIQIEGSGGNGTDGHTGIVAHLNDGALAVSPLDLGDGGAQGFFLFFGGGVHGDCRCYGFFGRFHNIKIPFGR